MLDFFGGELNVGDRVALVATPIIGEHELITGVLTRYTSKLIEVEIEWYKYRSSREKTVYKTFRRPSQVIRIVE